MTNGNKKRICIDCKEEKILNGYVFGSENKENKLEIGSQVETVKMM